MVSLDSTSRVMVFPVSVLTKLGFVLAGKEKKDRRPAAVSMARLTSALQDGGGVVSIMIVARTEKKGRRRTVCGRRCGVHRMIMLFDRYWMNPMRLFFIKFRWGTCTAVGLSESNESFQLPYESLSHLHIIRNALDESLLTSGNNRELLLSRRLDESLTFQFYFPKMLRRGNDRKNPYLPYLW